MKRGRRGRQGLRVSKSVFRRESRFSKRNISSRRQGLVGTVTGLWLFGMCNSLCRRQVRQEGNEVPSRGETSVTNASPVRTLSVEIRGFAHRRFRDMTVFAKIVMMKFCRNGDAPYGRRLSTGKSQVLL